MAGLTTLEFAGRTVGKHENVANVETCTELCNENEECKSLRYNTNKRICFLKNIHLDGSEPIGKPSDRFYSVFKTCRDGKRFLSSIQSFAKKYKT